jgi:hypothetical protein
MSPADMKQFLNIADEVLQKFLDALEDKGFISQLKNRKGEVELVKATYAGLKEANPPEYYRQIPSWVMPGDVF